MRAGPRSSPSTTSGALVQMRRPTTTPAAGRLAGARARAARRRCPSSRHAMRSLASGRDGALLAAASSDGHRADVWVAASTTGDADGCATGSPPKDKTRDRSWTPTTGCRLRRRVDGPFNLFARSPVAPSARGTARRLRSQPHPRVGLADGRAALHARHERTGMDVWRLTLQRARRRQSVRRLAMPHPLMEAAAIRPQPRWSPGGRWLACQSNASGGMARDRPQPSAPRRRSRSGPEPGRPALRGRTVRSRFRRRFDRCAGARRARRHPRSHAGARRRADCRARPRRAAACSERASAAAIPTRLEIVLEWSKELAARVPIRPKDVKAGPVGPPSHRLRAQGSRMGGFGGRGLTMSVCDGADRREPTSFEAPIPEP